MKNGFWMMTLLGCVALVSLLFVCGCDSDSDDSNDVSDGDKDSALSDGDKEKEADEELTNGFPIRKPQTYQIVCSDVPSFGEFP